MFIAADPPKHTAQRAVVTPMLHGAGRCETSSSIMPVHIGVQGAPGLGSGDRLDGSCQGIPPEEKAWLSGKLEGLHDRVRAQANPRACSNVAPGFHHTVVAKRNADAGVRTQQT